MARNARSFASCHVNQARRDALAADVVVINHHLFFADLAVRESGMAELLPTVRVAIFDEAHQLNETGVQFLGIQLTTGQILDFARDMLAAGFSSQGAWWTGSKWRGRPSEPHATALAWSGSAGPGLACAGSQRRRSILTPTTGRRR